MSIAHPTLAKTVFVSLSVLGFYTIVLHMYLSRAPDRFLEAHKASRVPLLLTGGRIPVVDAIIDPLISFFVAAFGDTSSPAYSTTTNFVWSFSAAIQLPLIEALRVRPDAGSTSITGPTQTISLGSRLLRYPVVWGILYQRLSGGWILPLWLLAFLFAFPQRTSGTLTRIEAESVFVGWWLGHTIPALLMLVPGSPPLDSPPAWIAFPILMSLVQYAYQVARERFTQGPDGQKGGYIVVQMAYASALMMGFASHVHLVLIPAFYATPLSATLLQKAGPLVTYFKDFFIPSPGFAIPSPNTTTAASGVQHFVQWDTIVVFVAVWIAVVWDMKMQQSVAHRRAQSVAWWKDSELWTAACVLLVGALVAGPGAATAGMMMYRERTLYAANVYSEAEELQKVVADYGATSQE